MKSDMSLSRLRGHFKTSRLHLRPLDGGAEALYCGLYTDPEVMRHIATPLSLDAAQRSFRLACWQAVQQPMDTPWWVMSEHVSRIDIGLIGMVRREAVAEIGIVLLAQWQGRGFATETIRVLTDLAFEDPAIAMLVLDQASDNGAMLGLMEKLEFRRAAVAGNDGRVRWQLARSRWRALRGDSRGLAMLCAEG